MIIMKPPGRFFRNEKPESDALKDEQIEGRIACRTLVKTIKFSPSTAGSVFKWFIDKEYDALHFTY